MTDISRRVFLKGGSILSFTKANLLHGKRFCVSNETNDILKNKYITFKTKEAFYGAISIVYESMAKKEEVETKEFVRAYKTAQVILVTSDEADEQMESIFEEMNSDLAEVRMFDECFEA